MTDRLPTVKRLRLPRSPTWRVGVPAVVLVLLVSSTAIFIRLTQEFEANHLREQQIADTLWVEQTIRFQLGRDEETLQLIVNDVDHNHLEGSQLLDRLEHFERSRHELHQVLWLPAAHQPASTAALTVTGSQVDRDALVRLARQTGRPVYSEPYSLPDTQSAHGPVLMEYILSARGGAVVAVLSLDRVLSELVPWWFAQRNELQIVDGAGTSLATRAAGGIGKGVYSHLTVLPDLGTDLYLKTNSIQDRPGIFSNALAATVILLSLTLIWSLYVLRKDMLWRQDVEEQLRTDMLRRERVEEQLRNEHAFRKAMDDSLNTGLRARDLAGVVTYVNPAFCKMVGFTADRLIGKGPPMPYWVSDALEDHARSLKRVLAGQAPADGYETAFQRSDGARIVVHINEAPLIDEDGQHTGWMSSVLDVTEHRRTEELNRIQQEKLLSSARLATMGELASTLSHELNQPLAAITSYSTGAINSVHRDVPEVRGKPELVDALEQIQSQAQRAGLIVKSVYNLVKKREPALSTCDLQVLVQGVRSLIELHAKKKRVVLIVSLPSEPIALYADPIMVEQVLINLARNAIEAMQNDPVGGRRLEISAAVEVLADQPGHHCAVVDIIDNGPGVARENQSQLFSPFFTTKREGMGMGLSICRSTIEFHGGGIDYSDRPGGGAHFRFTLPAGKRAPGVLWRSSDEAPPHEQAEAVQ